MTRLLVSVTSAAEAIVARDNGADLIDVKNPTLGSLGAQSPEIWREVLAAVGPQTPVSAALGELQDDNVFELARQTRGLAFAKVGLAHSRTAEGDWQARWREWQSCLASSVQPVLVLYADGDSCEAPQVDSLLKLAIDEKVPALLVDTYHKDRGRLFDVIDRGQLASAIGRLQHSACRIVLAGSLRLSDLPQLLPLKPTYVAVRGAVCRDARSGPIDGALVKEWSQALQSARG
jgi:uncharacterized protein (UPF0264 family)